MAIGLRHIELEEIKFISRTEAVTQLIFPSKSSSKLEFFLLILNQLKAPNP